MRFFYDCEHPAFFPDFYAPFYPGFDPSPCIKPNIYERYDTSFLLPRPQTLLQPALSPS